MKYGCEIVDRLVVKYRELLALRDDLIRIKVDMQSDLEGRRDNGVPPDTGPVDLAYLSREVFKLGDAIRKEFWLSLKFLEKFAGLRWLATTDMSDPEASDNVTGFIAVAKPKVQPTVHLPERDSKEYIALMNYLGCPQRVIEEDVLRPHYPHLKERIAALQLEGKPLPPGLTAGSTGSEYSLVSLRLKKGVNIVEEETQETQHGEEPTTEHADQGDTTGGQPSVEPTRAHQDDEGSAGRIGPCTSVRGGAEGEDGAEAVVSGVAGELQPWDADPFAGTVRHYPWARCA